MHKSFIRKTAIVMSAVMAMSTVAITGCSGDEEETEATTVETEAPTTTTTADINADLNNLFEMDDETWETFDFESIELPDEITPDSLNNPHMKDICQDYLDQNYMLMGGVDQVDPNVVEGFLGIATDSQLDFDSLSGDLSNISLGTTTSCTVMLFDSYESAVSFVETNFDGQMDLVKKELTSGVEYSGSMEGMDLTITVYEDGIVDMVEVMDMDALFSSMG